MASRHTFQRLGGGRRLPLVPLVVCTMSCIIGCRPEQPVPREVIRGTAMGTTWQVTVVDCAAARELDALSLGIADRLEHIESQMSHWRDDSLVSQFNRSESTGTIEIPTDLANVIGEAQRLHAETRGSFDVTAAPLVNLWGFGPSAKQQNVPSDFQIEDVLANVGSEQLVLVDTPGVATLSKRRPGVQIDLSALAKGYAVDVISRYLDAQQCVNYLIEFGGELRARGRNHRGNAWQIGLEQPDPRSAGQVRRTIALEDQAIATSGCYRNFRKASDTGTTYSHIIDPRTGHPVIHQLTSVSVIADTAIRADALATALMVLGPKDGYQWAIEHNVAATFVTVSPAGQVEQSTPAFDRP